MIGGGSVLRNVDGRKGCFQRRINFFFFLGGGGGASVHVFLKRKECKKEREHQLHVPLFKTRQDPHPAK